MKHSDHPAKHHRRLLVLVLLLLTLATVACGAVSKPEGWAAPVSTDDLVVIQDERGSITALRIGDGAPQSVWTFPVDSDDRGNYEGFYATPIVDRDSNRVFAAAYSGDVVALNLDDGTPAPGWPASVHVGGHIVSTPAFDGANLYVANSRGEIRTIDAATGAISEPLVDASERIWSGVVLEDGTLFVGSLGHSLLAVDRQGSVQWERNLGGAIAGDLLVDGDLLFVGTLQSRLHAFDLGNGGEERWEFEGDNWFWARPLVQDGTVYAATTGGSVYAIDRETGQQRWRFNQRDSEIRAAPVIVGDVLVVADRDGYVYGINPEDGALLWEQRQLDARFLADPLVLESTILYLSHDGTLVRVRPQDQGAIDALYSRS